MYIELTATEKNVVLNFNHFYTSVLRTCIVLFYYNCRVFIITIYYSEMQMCKIQIFNYLVH